MRTAFREMVAFLLLAACSAQVGAARWEIDPTIGFRAGYNDNLRLSTDNEVSSAEAMFSPGATFGVWTPSSGASGKVRFDFRRFEEDSDLDDNNSRFEINSYRSLERSRLGLDLGFIKDTTLDSQLEATGLAFDRVRRERITASPNWTYSLSERTQLSASYSYADVEYKNAGRSGFVNYTTNSALASLTRILSQRATASITLSRTESDNDNNVESANTNLQGGASYQFNETLSASLFAGARRTEVDYSQSSLVPIFSGNTVIGFVPLTSDVSNSDSGSTFSVSITKTFLRGESSLSATRDISNDINGEPIEVTRLRSTSRYRFTDTLSVGLNLEAYNSETNNAIGSSLNRDYYQIEPTFRWDLKEFWSLSGSYRYRRQTFDDISDDATQNAAYLTLVYHWPKIGVSR